jgi:hypothetical protein
MPENLSAEDQRAAQVTIQTVYGETIRRVLFLAAGLALAGALAAALMIEPGMRARNPP